MHVNYIGANTTLRKVNWWRYRKRWKKI